MILLKCHRVLQDTIWVHIHTVSLLFASLVSCEKSIYFGKASVTNMGKFCTWMCYVAAVPNFSSNTFCAEMVPSSIDYVKLKVCLLVFHKIDWFINANKQQKMSEVMVTMQIFLCELFCDQSHFPNNISLYIYLKRIDATLSKFLVKLI